MKVTKPTNNREGEGPRKYSDKEINVAMRLIFKKKKSISETSDITDISLSTIKRHKALWKAAGGKKPLPNVHAKRIFTDSEEKSLTLFISELETSGIKVKENDIRKIAYGFGQERGLGDKMATWKNNAASWDWLRGFKCRNPQVGSKDIVEHQNSDNEDQGGSKNTHISIEKENDEEHENMELDIVSLYSNEDQDVARDYHVTNDKENHGHVENMELANESLSASRDQLGSTEDENENALVLPTADNQNEILPGNDNPDSFGDPNCSSENLRVEGQQETLQEFQNPLDGFGGPVDSGENMNDILDSEHVSTGESGTLSAKLSQKEFSVESASSEATNVPKLTLKELEHPETSVTDPFADAENGLGEAMQLCQLNVTNPDLSALDSSNTKTCSVDKGSVEDETTENLQPREVSENQMFEFENELRIFVQELKSHGIFASELDIETIRTRCLEKLEACNRTQTSENPEFN